MYKGDFKLSKNHPTLLKEKWLNEKKLRENETRVSVAVKHMITDDAFFQPD